jgi:hypothetical protein
VDANARGLSCFVILVCAGLLVRASKFEPSRVVRLIDSLCVGRLVRTHTNSNYDANRRFKSLRAHQTTHGFELAFAFVLQDVLEVVLEVDKVSLSGYYV